MAKRSPVSLVIAAASSWLLVACDSYPVVSIENDTEVRVIAQAADFDSDRKSIEPSTTVEMAPLDDKSEGIYRILEADGREIGCLDADFKRGEKRMVVRVSEAVPCP